MGNIGAWGRRQKRKPWDQFAKNSAHSDGLQSDCRECKQAREAAYRAAKKAA